jgi:hypothetical protein
MDTNLATLRRFALTIALLLITYAAAGIQIDPQASISPFGFPFRVERADLLPIGLQLAALYSMARFYYYGLMLAHSPYRTRRDLLDRASAPGQPGGHHVPTYWGPVRLESKLSVSTYEEAETLATQYREAFPKFASARVSARPRGDVFTDEGGDPQHYFHVEMVVPLRCRMTALFQDLDYTSPVWLNLVALAFSVSQQVSARVAA